MLRNGNFEADWSEESSHRCKVFPVGGNPYEADIGNIFCPPGWTVWFRHEEGVWAQPECRDARARNPDRMRSGEKGYLVFTFGRKQDAGLMQQVPVEPGARLRFSAYAHAWSNHEDRNKPEKFPCPDDPFWSEGAGKGPYFELEYTPELSDEERNFTFWVGIDPTGGTNPFADTVVWGQGAHIYNIFHEVPAVEAVAKTDTVTVFTRSRAIWPFKHNDAYWDDAALTVVEGPPPPATGRGAPREQYERVYAALPMGISADDYARISLDLWRESKITVGGSYDDAGIGDLDKRTVLLYQLPIEQQQEFRDWYAEYYPGVRVEFREPIGDLPPPPPPPPPPPSGREILGPHIQSDLGAAQSFIVAHKPIVKLVNNFEWAQQITAWGGEVLVRFHFDDYHQFANDPDKPAAARRFLDAFWDSLIAQGEHIAYLQGLNETVHDAATLANSVAFELAVLDELERRGWPGRYVALAPSVGQPPQHDIHLMRPLAERLMETGGVMAANCYWPISLPRDAGDEMRAYKHPFDSYMEYAGRFELMREMLRMPDLPFIITEAGACGWVDWQAGGGGRWNPRAGWRDCYENFDAYLPHLLDYRERVLAAGNVLGVCLFTTYTGGNWPSFHYGADEWRALSEALG